MNRILIIGFQHSGTTILSSLVQNHPQVSSIFNEHRYIEVCKTKRDILRFVSNYAPLDTVWGDKIPWMDGKGDRIINLSKRWFKFFGKKARVVHILRHPLDVALSIDPLSPQTQLPLILKSMPKVIEFINTDERATTILYEDLLMSSIKTLSYLYSFCGLSTKEKIINRIMNIDFKFGKIDSSKGQSRVFAYKNKDISIEVDYNKLINMRKENV